MSHTLEPTVPDGAELAATVRGLASEVRQVVLQGGGDPEEIVALSRRIGSVRRQLHDLPPNALHRWLEGLQQQVDSLPEGAPSFA